MVNDPVVAQVTVPLPEYPALQATETVAPVDPEIEAVRDLSEFNTSVEVQAFAVQVTAVNEPLVWHVAEPEPE